MERTTRPRRTSPPRRSRPERGARVRRARVARGCDSCREPAYFSPAGACASGRNANNETESRHGRYYMTRAVRATAPALLLLLASAAAAQPGALPPAPDPANLRGDSTQPRKRLAEAEQKINAGKAADAADAPQRVLDESADALTPPDGRHYQTARWVAQGLLAKLPPD